MHPTRSMGAQPGERRSLDLAEGDRVADWIVAHRIASGGFGAVYAVHHARTGARAALKLLHAHLVTSPEMIARFEREIRIISTLRHPNIVRLVDAGFSADARPFLCMELLDGEELGQAIARANGLSIAVVRDVFEPICDALATAHAHGIVHRDIKSSNIMSCRDGRVVLLDFGIARISDALAPELTATNQALGTPSCMAPEQIQGQPPDPRTDVYALGGLLFHMLTGRMPFADPSPTMTQYLHLHARRPRASVVAHDIPVLLDDVIARAMAIDPAERFADARSLLAAVLVASRQTRVTRAVAIVDTIALLVSIADRTGGTAFDPVLLDDLEHVLPAAERLLGERGFALALDLGSSALFVAARDAVPDPEAVARETHARLAMRPGRDARVAVGVSLNADRAPFVGAEIQPCDLLQVGTWGLPDALDGVWISAAISASITDH